MLYELRPDLIPQGWATREELELWQLYYRDLNDRRHQR